MSAAKEIANIFRKYELTYDQAIQECKLARIDAKIFRPKRKRGETHLPTFEEISKFFKTIEKKSLVDKLMMKLLLYTGIRTMELVNIKIENIDLSNSGYEKIWLIRKGGAGDYVLIPNILLDMLKLYMETHAKKHIYLFESSYHKKYTERGIRKKFERYRREAGISNNVRAHNFRHAILTYLGGRGWKQQQLKNISGHKTTKSLDVYVDKNPETVRPLYDDAIRELEKDIFGGKK